AGACSFPRFGLVSRARRQPIEDDCGCPGLVHGAKGFAGEWLDVLGKADRRDLVKGGCPQTVRMRTLAVAVQRPPEQPVEDGSGWSAPVAAGPEGRIERARARRHWPAQPLIAEERLRIE